MNILKSEPAALADALEILTKRKGNGELGYEQMQALEHAELFCIMKRKESSELIEKIMTNKKISQELAIKLVDAQPSNPATVRAMASKEKIDLSDQEIEEIIKKF